MMDDIILRQYCKEIEEKMSQNDCKEWSQRICETVFGEEYHINRKYSMKQIVKRKLKKVYLRKCNALAKNYIPHYYYWKKKQQHYLFTNLNEIEDKYIHIKENGIDIDDEQRIKYENERTVRKYLTVIDYSFSTYYQNIFETIANSSAFFEPDLNYVLLNGLDLSYEKQYEVNTDEIVSLETTHSFLKFPEVTTKKEWKYQEYIIAYISKLLSEKIGLSIIDYGYIDTRKACLSIKENNINFRLAMLFYPQFRALYKKSGNCSCSLKSIIDIIDNIHEINLMSESDSQLFPFVAEQMFGINLCMQFTKYYTLISQRDEFRYGENTQSLLLDIFRLFIGMPNVFSRIQIVKEFMEPVIFFTKDLEKQLIIIKKHVQRLSKKYEELFKNIGLVIKNKKFAEEPHGLHLRDLKKRCQGIGYFKNLHHVLGKKPYIFVREDKEIQENPSIYGILQEEALRIIKQSSYHI